MKKNLDIMNPLYNEQIFPVPWHFVKSSFHCSASDYWFFGCLVITLSFFYILGECSNKECQYLHIDPESKIKDCPWYDRGFCKHGRLVLCVCVFFFSVVHFAEYAHFFLGPFSFSLMCFSFFRSFRSKLQAPAC